MFFFREYNIWERNDSQLAHIQKHVADKIHELLQRQDGFYAWVVIF